jgi:hypothetical protein
VKIVADLCLVVPTQRTDRAQEVHLTIRHGICDAVDEKVAGGRASHPSRPADSSERRSLIGRTVLGSATAMKAHDRRTQNCILNRRNGRQADQLVDP